MHISQDYVLVFRIHQAYPDLLVITDLCLCAYTYHGHCGIIHSDTDTTIDNTASIKRLAEVAVKYAAAGAQVIAPSDMMDGRIGAIKAGLAEVSDAVQVPGVRVSIIVTPHRVD
jgi:delta-aminolevulinic acid dehydratase/porphobilinogen synthase